VSVTKLKADIKENFLQHIGKAEDELLEKDRALLDRLASDSASLVFKSLSSTEDFSGEIAIINASLTNFAVAKYFPMKDIFWASVQRAVTLIVSVAVQAAIAAV